MEGGLSLGKNRVAGYLTSNNYYTSIEPNSIEVVLGIRYWVLV